MGCVQGKASPPYNRQHSRSTSLHKMKVDNGYAVAGPEKVFVQVKENSVKKSDHVGGDENDRKGGKDGSGNIVCSQRIGKKIGGDELVGGWPKWLVDNIPSEVLAHLVSKSADSYDKLAKVSIYDCVFYFLSFIICLDSKMWKEYRL